ncbi:MAG TPA: acyl-[ACP]--phospholipid O-acyltransferase [Verrucomicrobiae bacterium]|jgi:acyl-[acyl-carrier-protein]-phospholipid O-acyltransferase/long-chain-fatty-acid--[acyl-carrier-protein] ligase|nr:acyl-[ACP]--phospholipid O-acyltransferase [Verrucomicrobiae bacterium]
MNTSDSSQPTSTSLRGFWSLIVTQFQGAFSDNVLKNLVILLAIFGSSMTLTQQHQFGESIGALFSLPFILFSMAGGYLADRFSKRSVMLGVKVFELAIMSLVLAGLWTLNRHLLLACVFLMGTHSAFFGPSKYGSLPELLSERKLSWGNGLLELGTFMAIILGTVAAAVLSQKLHDRQWISGFILIALAVLGFLACLGITRVPAADPAKKFNANFPAEVWRQLRAMRGDRPLWLAIIGNTYFNFLGALLLLNLFFYGADVLHVDETHIGFLNVALALGIGLGSVAAGYLSGGKIEYGVVPLGAVGLSIFSALLALPGLSAGKALLLLALLGFTGGFFIVPISALLQHKPSRETKGEVQATANLLSFVGVFLASGAHWLLTQQLQFSPRAIFLAGGVMTLVGAIYVLWLLPEALLRFVLWLLTRTVYRIRVVGRENVPAKGGALFVSNHLSLADAMLLLASTDRTVRFMMYKAHYELPWIKPFARMLGVIPISSEQRPREMLKSLQAASQAIKNGDVVCIFAEGQITRIGQMMPFRRGFERIMKDVEAPIIPVALDGVWGSIFSFERGRFLWKWPRRFPHPITVNYGQPMPHTATPFEVRQAVQELMAEAWMHRKARMKTLHRAFVRTARRHRFRFAMAAAQNPKVRFGAVLARTVFLGRRLKKIWQGQKMVGLLLPPSVPGALVNFAAMLGGKVPVNLNYTVSEETLASCVRQCEVKTVVTSRAFLEKVKLKIPCETIYLEELAGAPSASEKLTALFIALFFPVGLLERALGREKKVELDDLATVIFSSGSTGEPKGVMLSHYNVGSNIEQLEQVFGLGERDCVLGVLPFFHSFGFTGTLCLPAVAGVGAIYHSNPLDTKTIGPLVREYSATFLLATPTFLQLYLRGCAPEDFGSLRVVMTGAEKLPERLATAFEEHFGVRPLEGYGCTECSPAVAVNTHDFRSAGFRQVGAKRGKIGHPLSGVSVRIVDPDTRAPLPVGQPGLMLVRGPNVMQGYLGKAEKSAEVLHDGWYTTGDIAAFDEDGFLQITDRLSRFSKIGGEMVPHIKVEERLHELAGSTEQTFVVAGVPDEKKGERLVVLHQLPDAQLPATLGKLSQTDLPNLWKPRPDQFFRVESFPMLGTGKLDLRKVKEIVSSLATKAAPEASQPVA